KGSAVPLTNNVPGRGSSQVPQTGSLVLDPAPGACPNAPIASALAFWLLRSVLGATLLPVFDPRGVQRAPHDVVPHTGQVRDAAPPHEHHRVLLQVVPLAGDVRRHLAAITEAHTRHFAQRRVRLSGSRRIHPRADPTFLWGAVELLRRPLQRVQ